MAEASSSACRLDLKIGARLLRA